jgi:hypothetical protein
MFIKIPDMVSCLVKRVSLQKAHIPVLLGISVLALALSATTYAVLITSQRLPSTGNVKAVGVRIYWDINRTQEVTTLNWGTIDPGTNRNSTVFIYNNGNVPLELNMTTSNWNPTSAAGYLRMTWNRENYVLNSSATVQTVLTLTVLSNVTGIDAFSFDITITGTER